MLKKILILTIIPISLLPSHGQLIRNLGINHAIVKANENRKVLLEKSIATDTIFFDTEFFEDFSSYHYEVVPRTNVWSDQYAFINSTYADSMISLGVATLDAYDQQGFPYYSSIQEVSEADTLTSQTFVFNEMPSDSLFFSFFYECGGKVSCPDSKDILLLDFYSAENEIWVTADTISGGEQMHTFKQHIVPVSDTLIENGFRFRFRNYVSLSMENIPGQDLGKYSNADQWHVDYIQLKSTGNRLELTSIDDMTIVKPLLPSLKELTAVPYSHYALAQSAIERTTIPITYRTIFPERSDIISLVRHYYSYDLGGNKLLRDLQYDENITPYDYFHEEEFFTAGFTYDEADTIGEIELTAVIEALAEDQKLVNDTVKRKEIYYDHYAYDDGTAELGLGIAGEYQNLNKIAVRFRVYRASNNPDTLKAILIYFNKSIDDYTSQSEYGISIRKNVGNIPSDDTLYTSKGFFPDYSLRLNEFARIELDRPIVVSDTFFVVIDQLDSYLNIGYDINNDNLNKIFFYTGQDWENSNSLPKGSLMVRASFGNHSLPLTKTETLEKSQDFKLFPNPVHDVMYFNLYYDNMTTYNIKVYNIMGVMLMNFISDHNSIDVSTLDKGIYILQMTSNDNKESITTKFLKE